MGAALLASLLLTGCSVMGFAFSQSLRTDNQNAVGLDGAKLRQLGIGSQLRGELFDGRSFGGRLVSIEVEGSAAYAERYAEWQLESGAWTPNSGESVRVVGSMSVDGYFEAFDFDGVWLRGRSEAIGLLNVERVQALERDLITSGDALREAAALGDLPFRSRLRLDRDGQRGEVRTERISRIATLRPAAWAWVPFAMGLAADVALIASIDTWP